MAVGDTTQGRRLPDDSPIGDVFDGEAGVYVLRPEPEADGERRVWMKLPNGEFASLPVGEDRGVPPRWALTEHDDGTITLSPSILMHPTAGYDGSGWHGYLEHGIWREV